VLNAGAQWFSKRRPTTGQPTQAEDLSERPGRWAQHRRAHTLEGIRCALERPRRILMMITRRVSRIHDPMIATLSPLLEERRPADRWRGNSLLHRPRAAGEGAWRQSFGFIAMGVSGGAKGALGGPSMMPAAPRAPTNAIRRLVAAKDGADPGGRWAPASPTSAPVALGTSSRRCHNGIEIRHRADPPARPMT